MIVVVFSLAFTTQAGGQQVFNNKEDVSASSAHIRKLKAGVLLVRIPSNQNKLDKIQEFIDSANTPEDEAKWQKEMRKALEETEKTRNELTQYVDAEYTFSEYGFFTDIDSEEVLNRSKAPTTSDLKTPVKIDPEQSIYVLIDGQTPNKGHSGYVILDKNLDNLPRPFPNNVLKNTLFGNKQKQIRKLNGRLEVYYKDVITD